MIAGHFRSGMLMSTFSTRMIAQLISNSQSPIPIDPFDLGRFGPFEA